MSTDLTKTCQLLLVYRNCTGFFRHRNIGKLECLRTAYIEVDHLVYPHDTVCRVRVANNWIALEPVSGTVRKHEFPLITIFRIRSRVGGLPFWC